MKKLLASLALGLGLLMGANAVMAQAPAAAPAAVAASAEAKPAEAPAAAPAAAAARLLLRLLQQQRPPLPRRHPCPTKATPPG
jgi:Amt family ammonium transporter